MEIKDKYILDDCSELLNTILKYHPAQGWIETQVANIVYTTVYKKAKKKRVNLQVRKLKITFDKRVIGSPIHGSQIFVYKYPQSFHRLVDEGIFKNVEKVNSLAQFTDEERHKIFEEALRNDLKGLTKSPSYDLSYEGHYKVILAYSVADQWLSENVPDHNVTGDNDNKVRFSSDLYDDMGKPTLKLFSKDIEIPKNTNQDYLCKVIFLKFPKESYDDLDEKELEKSQYGQKEWSWEEIVTIWGDESSSYDKKNWRKVYNAARSVNGLIAKETMIKDFFLTTTINSVKINPQYLR